MAVARAWGAPKTLAARGYLPDVVIDSHGTATVVWSTDSWRGAVMAVRRPAGGPWGKPVRIGTGTEPLVDADAAGNVTVVWSTNKAGRTTGVATARHPAGGRWTAPVRLRKSQDAPGYGPDSDEGTFGANWVDLTVSSGGAATAVWEWGSDDRGRPSRVQVAQRPRGGPWHRAFDLTPAKGQGRPVVVADARDRVTAVYRRHGETLLARRFIPGKGWSGPAVLSRHGSDPAIASNARGDVLVTFNQNLNHVDAVLRPAAGPWGTRVILSPRDINTESVNAALTGRGEAWAGWSRWSHGNERVDAVRRPPLGPWSSPAMLAEAGGSSTVLLANARGDVLMMWSSPGVGVRTRPPGGPWTRTTRLLKTDPFIDHADAALAPDGDAIVVWANGARPSITARVLTR